MSKIISIFNNKGGVGKTTYMYHVAHLLAAEGIRVLLVDCDGQCNLTSYCLPNPRIRQAWSLDGNSIWRNVELVARGMGDIRQRSPTLVKASYPDLYLVPGDLTLTEFEDRLGDSWSAAKGGDEAALRVQSALYRYIRWASQSIGAEIVMLDLGPNLGALNRAVLAGSDYFITPMAPDLFSIRGTKNLGDKLRRWNQEWTQCNTASRADSLTLPGGRPKFLGYVVQSHNLRNNRDGMTKGWNLFGKIIAEHVDTNIVDVLTPLDQVVDWEDSDYNLGQIPNLHSLIPYSQNARKPVFDCSYADGLRGDHIPRAAETRKHFKGIVDIIRNSQYW